VQFAVLVDVMGPDDVGVAHLGDGPGLKRNRR
jgi:hypothetical protein